MRDQKKILCIGAANIDRVAQCTDKPTFGESNPVQSLISVGGVSANIARNLKQLKHEVGIMAYIGKDDFGQHVYDNLVSHDLDVSLIEKHPELTTASYTAVTDPNGSLLLGLEDMRICEELTPSFLKQKCFEIFQWSDLLFDANLPPESAAFLAEKCPDDVNLYTSMVSPGKVHNVRPSLHRLTALFGNKSEISTLYGIQIKTENDALEAAKRLHADGVKYAFITCGQAGVAVCSDEYVNIHSPFPIHARHDNGAGDAFASGVISGLLDGMPVIDALHFGLGAASLTLEFQHHPVGHLSKDKIEARIEQSLKDLQEGKTDLA